MWEVKVKVNVSFLGFRRSVNILPLFSDFLKLGLVVRYRRFGRTYRSCLQGFQFRLRKIPEGRRPQVTVKFSLHKFWAHVGETEVRFHSFLISVPDNEGSSSSRPIPCRKKDPGTHIAGGWVDTRGGMDGSLKQKSRTPDGIWTPDRTARSLDNEDHKSYILQQHGITFKQFSWGELYPSAHLNSQQVSKQIQFVLHEDLLL